MSDSDVGVDTMNRVMEQTPIDMDGSNVGWYIWRIGFRAGWLALMSHAKLGVWSKRRKNQE